MSEETRTPEQMAVVIWNDFVARLGLVEINGSWGRKDQYGTPYSKLTVGLGREDPVQQEGMPFESVLIDFTAECRMLAFTSSLERWLDGRTVIVWRKRPQGVAFTEDSQYSGELPSGVDYTRCSQMTACLSAYFPDDLANMAPPTRPILTEKNGA